MGIDISRGPSLNWSAWRYCLDTAVDFGWVPAGTELRTIPYTGKGPTDEERSTWSGTYCSNDFQCITDADAKALAKALNTAIAAVEAGTAPETGEGHHPEVLRLLADRAGEGGFYIY
jgi:hypothetical protein